MSVSEDFDLLQFFHENSKRNIYRIIPEPDMNIKPPTFKEYLDCPRITLPAAKIDLNISLDKSIIERRSCRNFEDKTLSLKSFSKILYFGYGVTHVMDFENFEILGRACPSGGALYPYEIYPVVFNVDELEQGIYHYCPFDHSVELLKTGDFVNQIIQLFMQQYYIANSSACIVLSSVLERTTWKYGSRGYRYMLLEAGHLAQNMCLISTANGLGTLLLGGFYDDPLARLIGVDPILEPIMYGLAIGHKAA
jgi:SagB-type dehydrogenase family enzyme